jgi:AraC-like DNA-binding protein
MTSFAEKKSGLEGTVRIATVIAIPVVLKRLGYDPDVVLREAEFDARLFDDPDNVITLGNRSRLIQHCVNKTGCSHFGFLVGQQTGSSALGLVGFLMQNSPDVMTALHALVHYSHLHVRGAVIYLEKEQKSMFLGYRLYQPDIEAHVQIEDGAVAIMLNVLRKLCGPSWNPDEIHLRRNKPADSRVYKQFFNAPLKFSCEHSGLLFPAHWLGQPVVNADPELYRYLKSQTDKLNLQYSEDFTDQVIRAIHSSLFIHKATTEHIAALFAIHPRTLNRRLKSYGTSFQELTDQCSFEIAKQLLLNTSMQLMQIAATLNYADASAFTRAFRRWSGTTPSLWREQHRQAGT